MARRQEAEEYLTRIIISKEKETLEIARPTFLNYLVRSIYIFYIPGSL